MSLNHYRDECHRESKLRGWWKNIRKDNQFIVPTKLCLIHSEISEALEAARKNTMDSHLPTRSGLEVELADALIRIFDLAGYLALDLEGAYQEKRAYNLTRADHNLANRASSEGKKF